METSIYTRIDSFNAFTKRHRIKKLTIKNVFLGSAKASKTLASFFPNWIERLLGSGTDG